MSRFLVGILLGCLMSAPPLEAIRLSSPPTVVTWDASSLTQLNLYLASIRDVVNGRYTVDVVTTSPNGSRAGEQGDEVLFNASGTWKKCFNISATTASSPTGTTWRCSANALTAP